MKVRKFGEENKESGSLKEKSGDLVYGKNRKEKTEKFLDKIKTNIAFYSPKKLYLSGLVPSAVLIPIYHPKESIIFIKRTMKVKDHKGQIAFPGGVMDSGEDAVKTALREAEEEVGIPRNKVEVIGFLDDTITIAGYLIHPVVGVIYDRVRLKPNPDEVDEILIIPIEDIVKSEYIEGGDLRWEFHVGEIVIWGATARILKNFLDVSGLRSFSI